MVWLDVIDESKLVNAGVFSLLRLELLTSLASTYPDGVQYRELKASLNVNDGVLYANLDFFVKTGLAVKETVKVENKNIEAYRLTKDGLDEFKHVISWLKKFVEESEKIK